MSFCYAPWTNIDIKSSGLLRPCCFFKYSKNDTFNVYDNTIEEYADSEFLKNLKNDFINGKKPKGCQRCWTDEDSNIKSKRILDIERWNRDFESYDLDSGKFLTVSLGMGNTCNLKCRTCDGKASSKWVKEELQYGIKTNKIHEFYKNDAFTDQVKGLIGDIIQLDISGGEPLVAGVPQQLDILDTIINANQADKVKLHYTTNLTMFPNKQFWKRWDHFKNIDFSFSIDGLYDQFEYLRHPAVWDDCYQNLKKYQSYAKKKNNIQISISHTVSAFTIFYLPEFFNWCIKEGLPKPWTGRVRYPLHYQLGIFPDASKQIIKDKLLSHVHKDVRVWADEVFVNDNTENLQDFWIWTNQVDQYRDQSFKETFPELADLLRLPS